MKKLSGAAINILNGLARYGNQSLTEKDFDLLLSEDMERMKANSTRLIQIDQAVIKGFYVCAEKGDLLYSRERVISLFGKPIEENYPEASAEFIKFAWAYWTLKALLIDMQKDNIQFIGQGILSKLESEIAAVFFPTPGPNRIDPKKRETFQRELLSQYSDKINIESFMNGNPILIRDRATRSGCLSVFIVGSFILSTGYYFFYLS